MCWALNWGIECAVLKAEHISPGFVSAYWTMSDTVDCLASPDHPTFKPMGSPIHPIPPTHTCTHFLMLTEVRCHVQLDSILNSADERHTKMEMENDNLQSLWHVEM